MSPQDHAENDENIRKPYDASIPIEELYNQIKTSLEISILGNNPYTTNQILTIAMKLIEDTGLFQEDYKRWRRKPVIQQNWPNFKLHFTEEYKQYLTYNRSTISSVMRANATTQPKTKIEDDFVKETVEAIQFLANNATTNTSTLTNLQSQVFNLESELSKLKDIPFNHLAILDSGTTSNLICPDAPATDHSQKQNSIEVQVPNGDIITSNTMANLTLKNIPEKARKAHVFPSLAHNLISIGILCDNDCSVLFLKDYAYILHDKKLILKGKQQKLDGMWYINLNHNEQKKKNFDMNTYLSKYNSFLKTNNILTTHKIKDIINFYHACLYSPVKTTWIEAIKNGHFHTWPYLTVKNIKKYLNTSIATIKGHQRQQYQNTASTKYPEDTNEKLEHRTNIVFAAITDPTDKAYSDFTGLLPVISSRGYKQFLVLYCYDANAIICEPIKNRLSKEIKRAFKTKIEYLKDRGLKPLINIMDNEASKELKRYISLEEEMKYELVPPHIHRRNAAEQAITTFKDHLISGFHTADPDFPMYLWCRLAKQTEMTLNMLRKSILNPKISSYCQLEGKFNFLATPLAPPGSKAIIYETPTNRPSWGAHGSAGFYTSTSMEHYRSYKIYIPHTSRERIATKVDFLPCRNINPPTITPTEEILSSAKKLTEALSKDRHEQSPLLDIGLYKESALKSLSKIFNDKLEQLQLPRVNKEYNQLPRVKKPSFYDLYKPPPFPGIPTPKTTTAVAANTITQQKMIEELGLNAGYSMEYRDLIKSKERHIWEKSCRNELGRLAQELKNRINGTNTIYFVKKSQVPKNKTVTYPRIVCDIRPTKPEPFRTRITAGGNLIEYHGKTSTPTAELVTIKTFANSIISTKNARSYGLDIKNFYICHKLKIMNT